MKRYGRIYFCLLFLLIACENLETGKTLQRENIAFIKTLGLLDEDEQIILYYSNFKKSRAGNFLTEKRIAHYWLDQRNPARNDTSFAFFQNIASLDTVYNVPDFDAPYLVVNRKDRSSFKVYAGGGKKNVRRFFETALALWQSKKK